MGNSLPKFNNMTDTTIIKGGFNNENRNNSTEHHSQLENAMDYIATYYILTLDFQSFKKLYNKKYCDELVILTSDIIDRYFSDIDITRLVNRIRHGSSKEKILFFKKSDLNHLSDLDADINTDIDILDYNDKEIMCDYIATFYIKIAHIFAAILTTINPEYVFMDSTGKKIKRKLSEKLSIPTDATIEKTTSSFCDDKISALKGNENTENKKSKNSASQNLCSADMYSRKQNSDAESLDDIHGIPELMQLYYDDDYDYETGEFNGMTKETHDIFHADLARFYKAFTGNDVMPINIKSFSDIKLKEYSKNCSQKNLNSVSKFESEYTESYKNQLFEKYAENLKKMLASVNEKQSQLLKIINEIFLYDNNDETLKEDNPEKHIIKINHELTEERLQELVEEVRGIIVELYINCETDFDEGVKLYEAIVESQILETSQKQIKTLETEMVKLYNPYTFAKKI